MSKKNKKKKINKLLKEVERKREIGLNSLVDGNLSINEISKGSSVFSDIGNWTSANTEKSLSNFIQQWKSKNARIFIGSFLTEFMNEKYSVQALRWSYVGKEKTELTALINLINNKDEDERIYCYISNIKTDDEDKKKGKYIIKLQIFKNYRDPKTNCMMQSLVRGITYTNEL